MHPPALRYNPERIRATIAALEAVGVDYTKALNRWPILWSSDPGCWGDRMAVLRELGLDAAKVVTSSPSALSHPPDTLRAKIQALQATGLDVSKVVRHCPSVFGYGTDRIRSTLAFLDGVGLDGVRIVNAVPAILCYSVDAKLRPIVNFVTTTMGRNVTELSRHPACFCFSLNGRLVPRYQFAVLHDKQTLSLNMLFGTTDVRFQQAMGQPRAVFVDFLAHLRM
jgi:hypothetical protein